MGMDERTGLQMQRTAERKMDNGREFFTEYFHGAVSISRTC